MATKAGVVIEAETKEKKVCAEDVSYVMCVVAEEGAALGGGAVSACVSVNTVGSKGDNED